MAKPTLSILALSLGLILSAPSFADPATGSPQPLTVSTASTTGQTQVEDEGLCTVVCPLPG